jgi:hypothetical protein
MTDTPRPISSFRASAKNPKTRSTRVWTDAQRAAAALRARQTRPWLHATGPRTPEGKARSARNALKHGYYSAAARAKRAFHRARRAFVGHMKALLRLENYLVKSLKLPYNPAIKGLWEAYGRFESPCSVPHHSPRFLKCHPEGAARRISVPEILHWRSE